MHNVIEWACGQDHSRLMDLGCIAFHLFRAVQQGGLSTFPETNPVTLPTQSHPAIDKDWILPSRHHLKWGLLLEEEDEL